MILDAIRPAGDYWVAFTRDHTREIVLPSTG